MLCLKCNKETNGIVCEVDIEQEIDNKNVIFPSLITVCEICGYQTLTEGQLNILLDNVKFYKENLKCRKKD